MRKGSRSWATAMYFFGHHGLGPYECYFCEEVVTIEDDGPRTLNIHHVNHDHEDNASVNLVASHQRCHMQYHGRLAKGNRTTGEQRTAALQKAWATRRARYGDGGRKEVTDGTA